MSELSEHLKLQIVRHSMESEEEARQRKSELAAPSGYAALLLLQWAGRINALSDMQHRYVEQGQYAEAIVARAQRKMLITCCNDLKQHIHQSTPEEGEQT